MLKKFMVLDIKPFVRITSLHGIASYLSNYITPIYFQSITDLDYFNQLAVYLLFAIHYLR